MRVKEGLDGAKEAHDRRWRSGNKSHEALLCIMPLFPDRQRQRDGERDKDLRRQGDRPGKEAFLLRCLKSHVKRVGDPFFRFK